MCVCVCVLAQRGKTDTREHRKGEVQCPQVNAKKRASSRTALRVALQARRIELALTAGWSEEHRF